MITIRNKADCCGCEACVQKCSHNCINFTIDKEGFYYPKVNQDLCVDCGVCDTVCPVINQSDETKPVEVFAAKCTDDEIRLKSSSGGLFSSLAEYVLSEGGVVFGAVYDQDWNVKHISVDDVSDLPLLRGSKYIQSRIGDSFAKARNFLRAGRLVLFVGTACQIAGLKLFLKKEYDNLLAVDVVCHGVPSRKVWQRFVKHLVKSAKNENKVAEVESVSFRDKSFSWKHYSSVLTVKVAEKRKQISLSRFMEGFVKDLYLRPSCYACPSKKGKCTSDITLGDFWGIENIYPEFDDDKGASLVLINSPAGKIAFEKLHTENIKSDYNKALKCNKSLEHSAKVYFLSRKLFFSFMPLFNIHHWVKTAALFNGLLKRIKKIE